MGRARIRRPRPLRKAGARRLSGRAVLDHHPAQARELPPRLRGLRSGGGRLLRRRADRSPDARSRHRAEPRQDRGRGRERAGVARRRGARGLFAFPVAVRGRAAGPEPAEEPRPCAGGDRTLPKTVERPQGGGLRLLRPDHRLRLHAGGRHDQRPPRRLLPPRRMRGARPTSVMPLAPQPKPARAWQRMLSGRRLDLLDPSPLDVELEDIAHGLARVARWNGQTAGPHIFSVAQHTLLVEAIARRRASLDRSARLAILLHDAPEYVVGDMITPFKAVIGDSYKAVEHRLLAAIHVRFGLPPSLPPELTRMIKSADRAAAYLEATRLAGFKLAEAQRFFGTPPDVPASFERDYLVPWNARDAEARYLRRFSELQESE